MNYLKKNIDIAGLVLIFACLISFWGGIVYRVYSLNNIGVIISLILAVISFFIILYFGKPRNAKPLMQNLQHETNDKKLNKNQIFVNLSLVICYLSLAISSFYILFTHQTAQAIISPWQVTPGYFFIAYGLATAILAVIIIKSNLAIKQFNNLTIVLLSLHYFLSFSVALIIYKIGYGFDPFVHQATLDLIDKTGAVFPKPFYYLGQYSLEIIIHKVTDLPLVWIDKLLVPLFAAVYLPITLWKILQKWFSDKASSLFLILAFLILPFSFFIITTPQNLAYLFLIIAILLGLTCNNLFDLIIIYLLSLTAIIIQPIAGIPALFFSLLLTVYHSDKQKIKSYGYILIFVISSISLPAAFYLLGKSNKITLFNEGGVKEFMDNILPKLIVPGQENFILNFIYLYGFNLKIIICLLAIAGLIIAYRHRKQCKIFFIYLLMSASLGLSYFLTAKLPFLFLIDYERNNYIDRLSLIAAFFLLPFIIIALYGFIEKLLKQVRAIKIPFLIFIIIMIATSLYLSYPRFDRYYNSRGYSTSQNDIDAVRWIEKNTSEDYIVLANQQVSAAALKEFGFKKYYSPPLLTKERDGVRFKSEIFYYPVPTGGPLYQYYLDMVYKKPSRAAMNAAMDLAGVKKGYFVLNKYWWAFPKILEEAKLEADGWREFGSGEVYVFEYKK